MDVLNAAQIICWDIYLKWNVLGLFLFSSSGNTTFCRECSFLQMLFILWVWRMFYSAFSYPLSAYLWSDSPQCVRETQCFIKELYHLLEKKSLLLINDSKLKHAWSCCVQVNCRQLQDWFISERHDFRILVFSFKTAGEGFWWTKESAEMFSFVTLLCFSSCCSIL